VVTVNGVRAVMRASFAVSAAGLPAIVVARLPRLFAAVAVTGFALFRSFILTEALNDYAVGAATGTPIRPAVCGCQPGTTRQHPKPAAASPSRAGSGRGEWVGLARRGPRRLDPQARPAHQRHGLVPGQQPGRRAVRVAGRALAPVEPAPGRLREYLAHRPRPVIADDAAGPAAPEATVRVPSPAGRHPPGS